MNHPPGQPPFYLWNPHRTRFAPTPHFPQTLGAQLNEIRAYLQAELDDEDIPQKKKHGSLEHFLGGGNHDMEEMVCDMQVANQTINRSSEDKCTLRHTLGDMRVSRFSKRLHQFDTRQMMGFKLQPQPEGLPLFPSQGFVKVEKKPSSENLKKQKKLEKKRRRRARKEANILMNTATEDESSQSQYPKSSQETFTSLDDEIFHPKIKHITVPSLKSATDLSGLVFQQQKQSSRIFSSVASKKSVAHALKGVRGLTLTAISAASSRGRGHSKRPGKTSNKPRKSTALKPMGRGRGRPRKNFVGGHVAVTQNRRKNQSAAVKLTPEVRVPSLSQSPTPSPPSRFIMIPSPPAQLVPQDNLEPVSISKFCGLKMTMKLNRPMSQSPSPAPKSSQSTPENTRSRPRLICKIKVPKEYQSPKPKPVIEPVKRKLEVVLEDDEDDDEDDAFLDTY